MNPFSLHGHKALVTGANTGLGQAIAVGLAQAGAEVVCAARRDCAETLAQSRQRGARPASCVSTLPTRWPLGMCSPGRATAFW